MKLATGPALDRQPVPRANVESFEEIELLTGWLTAVAALEEQHSQSGQAAQGERPARALPGPAWTIAYFPTLQAPPRLPFPHLRSRPWLECVRGWLHPQH